GLRARVPSAPVRVVQRSTGSERRDVPERDRVRRGRPRGGRRAPPSSLAAGVREPRRRLARLVAPAARSHVGVRPGVQGATARAAERAGAPALRRPPRVRPLRAHVRARRAGRRSGRRGLRLPVHAGPARRDPREHDPALEARPRAGPHPERARAARRDRDLRIRRGHAMTTVIDGDGHIFEWDRTFADEYLDPEFRHRRPTIVDGPQQLHWLIDNMAYPGLYGADRFGFEGSPVSRDDVRRDTIVPKKESLDVLEIRDPAERLALHKAEGIDRAVIYPTLFLIRPLSRDRAFEAALCRSYNSWMSDVCKSSDGTLEFVAVVDIDEPDGAAAEIARAKGLGAVGVMAPGMNGKEAITAPRLEPFWAAAAAHDLAVGVHVAYCTPLDTFTFVFSVLMGCEQVAASGVLDRHPALRVAFLETSCNWVPFLIERLEEKANPARRRFKPD